MVFEPFSAENRYRAGFAHFGLESARVFEATTGGGMNVFVVSIPNE